MTNIFKRLINISIYIAIFLLSLRGIVFAGPTSTSYQLLDYGFGAGGTVNSNSTNYMFQGILGELETASPSSANYMTLPGLTYTLEPNTPNFPNFTNPSNYFNRLQLIIDTANNPTDTTYVINISTDAFNTNSQYVQADGTLGSNPVWQTNASWGTVNIINLDYGTTYYARVAAKRGTFQQGKYSGISNASTITPTFSFNLEVTNQPSPPYTIGIGVITPGQVTTSWQKITATISTNANNGGIVYANGANSGLLAATTPNHLIASVQNDLSSGGVTEGYGLRGVSATQTSGTMQLISPYNLDGNNVGIIDTTKRPVADSASAPVTNGIVNLELKAKAGTTTQAATDYGDTITIVASGVY